MPHVNVVFLDQFLTVTTPHFIRRKIFCCHHLPPFCDLSLEMENKMEMNPQVRSIVEQLQLEPHIEGGFFRETYRSPLQVSVVDQKQKSYAASTSIYFLLATGQVSRLHRIQSDEVWHFYHGDPLTVVVMDDQVPGKHCHLHALGNRLELGERPQLVVPSGCWFGAYLDPVESQESFGYSLVGCTVAPGFTFDDFELATPAEMLRCFPAAGDIIDRMT